VPSDFDAKASTWDDDPEKVRRAKAAATAIRTAVPLNNIHPPAGAASNRRRFSVTARSRSSYSRLLTSSIISTT
jgi:hypothetical protein